MRKNLRSGSARILSAALAAAMVLGNMGSVAVSAADVPAATEAAYASGDTDGIAEATDAAATYDAEETAASAESDAPAATTTESASAETEAATEAALAETDAPAAETEIPAAEAAEATEIAPAETEDPAVANAVASITDASGAVTYYASLFDTAAVTDEAGNETTPAVAGAVSSLKAGETLTLLQDVSAEGTSTTRNSGELIVALDGEATFDLNGHTLSVKMQNALVAVLLVSSGTLNIKNGTLTADSNGRAIFAKEGTTVNISDMTVNAASYSGGVRTSGVLTIANSTISTTSYDAVWLDENANGTITDSTLSADSTVAYNSKATLVMNNVSAATTGDSGRGVYTTGDVASTTLDNVNVTAASYAVYAAGGTTVINSGTYEAGTADYAVYANDTAKVTINDGRYKAAVRGVNKTVSYPEGKILNNVVDSDGYFVLVDTSAYVPSYVASVGDVSYEYFSEAIAAAVDQSTVTLLADIILAADATIGATDQTVTIDLNGYTLDGNGYYVRPGGNFTMTDTSTEQTGLWKSARVNTNKSATLASFTLTNLRVEVASMFYVAPTTSTLIEGCTAEGASGFLSVTKGSVTLKNNVITNTNTASGGDAIRIKNGSEATTVLEGNTVKSTNSAIEIGSGCNVTINGGYYEGETNAIDAASDSQVVINDGEFVSAGSYAVKSTNKVTVNGGYYKADTAVKALTTVPTGKHIGLIEDANDAHNGWYGLLDGDAEAVYTLQVTHADGTIEQIEDPDFVGLFLQDQDVITVLDDITLTSAISIPASVSVTFDLNGKAVTEKNVETTYIYCAFAVGSGSTLTLKDSVGGGSVVVELPDSVSASTTTALVQYLMSNTVVIESGNYTADFMTMTAWGGTLNVTGGTFNLKHSLYVFNMGLTANISGGTWKKFKKSYKDPDQNPPVDQNPSEVFQSCLAAGATTEDAAVDGYLVVKQGEVEETGIPYAASYTMTDASGNAIEVGVDAASAGVDMSGKAWMNLTLPAATLESVTDVKDANGTAVSDFTFEKTDDAAVLSIAITAIGDTAGANTYTVSDGTNAYTIVLDMSAYNGPLGESKTYEVTVNHSGTAMSAYSFDTVEKIYAFDNGYNFMLVDMNNFFGGMGYDRSGGTTSGELKDARDENGNAPKYINTLYEAMTSSKFGDFNSLAQVVVSLNDGQEKLTLGTEMKIDAMGFDVTLTDTLTWTNPDMSATLEDLIAQAEALNEADYTAASWKTLADALAVAKTVAANENATEDEIDAAKVALTSALATLAKPEVVDRTALDAAIAEAEALNEADYTAASWETLQTALTNAKSLGEDATQAQVDSYLSALEKSLGALVKNAAATDAPTETSEPGSMKEGVYTVAVDLRNNSNPDKSSMSAPVLNKEAKLTVKADGTMELALNFPKDVQIANTDVHVTNIDVYEQDGETKMPTTITTYKTTLYGGEEGDAMTDAVITLTYESETGLYAGYIYSDFMSAPVQLYVDFSTVARVEGTVVYGDVNGDKEVSVKDALQVLRSVVGLTSLTETQTKAADVDGKNGVKVDDALYILKKVVRLIDKFPVEP